MTLPARNAWLVQMCVLFLLSVICNKKALQGILAPGCEEVRQFLFLARRKFMGWFLQINVRCSWWSHFCWLRRGPEKSWQIHLLASVDTLCETTAPRNRPKPRRKHSSSQPRFSAAQMLLVSGEVSREKLWKKNKHPCKHRIKYPQLDWGFANIWWCWTSHWNCECQMELRGVCRAACVFWGGEQQLTDMCCWLGMGNQRKECVAT